MTVSCKGRIGWAGIAVLVLFAAGCTRRVEQEAEKQFKAALPEYVGPAERYDVRVRSDSAGAVMRGRLRQVRVDGRKVQVEPTLTLDRLTLDFEEVSLDTRARRLQSIGRATFECRIHAPVLQEYVRRQHPEIPDLGIALRADSLFITARPDALGLVEKPFQLDLPGKLPVTITVEGKLTPSGPTQLNFSPEKAGVSIVPIPRFALEFLAKRLNPVVNLSTMKVPIQADRAFVRGEYLHFTGTIRPEDLLRLPSR
ncbi:MAG: DUF2993 domain-containing protein [Capsulimonadales bacterium]|nr:DUF2993 domain-containing protein [Capsulimonadales bacterium]